MKKIKKDERLCKTVFQMNTDFIPEKGVKIYSSSPNSSKAKELVFSECPEISLARKKSHLVCNHERITFLHESFDKSRKGDYTQVTKREILTKIQ